MQHSKYYPTLLFVLALAVCLIGSSYFNYITLPPMGLHVWRQADSASFVAHYYYNGLQFFEPGTLNLDSVNANGASEFPILYYIAAIGWKLLGPNNWILHAINSVIVFTGFYCLFLIARQLIGNVYIALFSTLLLLSSPTLLIYTNFFLPDPPSLGLTLIGAYFIFRFVKTGQYRQFVYAFIFFTLASLIKISFMVFPLAVVSILLAEKVLHIKLDERKLFAGSTLKFLSPVIAMLILTGLWWAWTRRYNLDNGCNLFLTQIQPIWTDDNISYTLQIMQERWFPHYYYLSTIHVLLAISIIGLFTIRHWPKLLVWLNALLMFGGLLYSIFFFKQFRVHDYYILALYIPLFFYIITTISILVKWLSKYRSSIIVIPLALLGINIASWVHTGKKQAECIYAKDQAIFSLSMTALAGHAEEYGLPQDAVVACMPDHSPNSTLYYLQRKGFTNWRDYRKENVSVFLQSILPRGITHIVITQPEYYEFAQSKWFTATQVGQYKDIRIFKVAINK